MKKLFYFLCFLVVSCRVIGEEPDVLFVLYELGETQALLPVIQKCEKEKIPIQVLAFGPACTLLKKCNPEGEIDQICSLYHPKVVVSGVASQVQGQVLAAFRNRAKTIAYWDSFSASDLHACVDIAKEADIVLFPSKMLAESSEFKDLSAEGKVVVGHPVLEEWREKLHQVDKEAVLNKLGCHPDRMVVTYMGSFGTEYKKAYPLFLDYIERVEKDYDFVLQSENEKVNVLIQTYAKWDDQFEKEVSPEHFIINQVTPLEAIAVADMVICYNSMAGYQALLMGKDLFYFIPAEDPLTNSAIECGIAKKISSPEEFEQAFNKSHIDAAEVMGIPTGSVDRIFDVFNKILQK